MTQIKDLAITKITANDSDLLIMQNPATGETYKITKADLFKGLSSSSTPGSSTPTTGTNRFFVSPGDTNGVFYWIGTSEGSSAWSNPISNGLTITASSIANGTLASLTDRQPSMFFTGNDGINNSFVAFSLGGNRKLKCNYYSIKSRNGYGGYYLRSWNFQGSDNGTNWLNLDVQVNNTSLNNDDQWLVIPINSDTAYSRFRILLTGNNSAGDTLLILGEVELYGIYTS